MSDLDEELANGVRVAEALVAHLFRIGGAGRVEIPISHVDADGALSLWKVIVERVGRLDFGTAG